MKLVMPWKSLQKSYQTEKQFQADEQGFIPADLFKGRVAIQGYDYLPSFVFPTL